MKPSNEVIEKFRKIYFEEFGEEISKEEAYGKFLRLVNFLRAILSPSSDNGKVPKNYDPFSLGIDHQFKSDRMK